MNLGKWPLVVCENEWEIMRCFPVNNSFCNNSFIFNLGLPNAALVSYQSAIELHKKTNDLLFLAGLFSCRFKKIVADQIILFKLRTKVGAVRQWCANMETILV